MGSCTATKVSFPRGRPASSKDRKAQRNLLIKRYRPGTDENEAMIAAELRSRNEAGKATTVGGAVGGLRLAPLERTGVSVPDSAIKGYHSRDTETWSIVTGEVDYPDLLAKQEDDSKRLEAKDREYTELIETYDRIQYSIQRKYVSLSHHPLLLHAPVVAQVLGAAEGDARLGAAWVVVAGGRKQRRSRRRRRRRHDGRRGAARAAAAARGCAARTGGVALLVCCGESGSEGESESAISVVLLCLSDNRQSCRLHSVVAVVSCLPPLSALLSATLAFQLTFFPLLLHSLRCERLEVKRKVVRERQ